MIQLEISNKQVRDSKGNMHQRYVTRLAPAEKVKGDEFLNLCSERGRVPRYQVESTLGLVGEVMLGLLCEGMTVEVPHVGVFRLGLEGRATDSREEAGLKAINKTTVNYHPAPKIRDGTHLMALAIA
ncbi:MAG: hypothetical protein IKH97_02795 [Bacteroidales bacterium]|nr:hypothetical protein [Bacteroidales bacterium]